MTSPFWAKLWIEILDDPKIAGMSDHLFRQFIYFMLAAKEYYKDGLLPPLSDLAWRLRIGNEECTEALEALGKIGVARETEAGWELINFAKRQAIKDPTNAERQKRYKEKRNALVTRYRNALSPDTLLTRYGNTVEEEEEKEEDIEKGKEKDVTRNINEKLPKIKANQNFALQQSWAEWHKQELIAINRLRIDLIEKYQPAQDADFKTIDEKTYHLRFELRKIKEQIGGEK